MQLTTVSLLLLIGLIMTSQISYGSTLTLSSVDQYLSDSEAKYTDLIDKTNKRIRWYDGVKQSDLSIVYLHGFSASRQEINPTTDLLADKLEANIYYARLAGHGRSEDAMTDGSIEAWLDDAKQAYEIGALIGKNVIVMSTSTGGTLATWLAAQPNTNQLMSNIMISPNYAVKNKLGRLVQWNWGLALVKWLKGPYYTFEPQNAVHAQYWTERYPFEALRPMFKLIDMVDKLDKSQISVPQLIVYSSRDQVIEAEKISTVAPQFINSQTTLREFTDSTDPYQHVLAGAACSPESTQMMVDLVADYIYTLRKKY